MTPRQLELGLDVITGVIVISVAVALAGLTWRLLGQPGGKPREVVAVAPVSGPPPPLDLTPVIQFAPFGAAVDPTTSVSGLTLRGILRANPSSASTALISVGGGPAQALGVGGILAGGASIDSIAVDHVVLRVSGRLQSLGFPEKPAEAAGVVAIRAAIPAAVTGQAPSNSLAATVLGYRDQVAAGSASLASGLGATASVQGYRIGPNPSADMRAAGLLPGDVVQKVNGVPVGSSDGDRQVFDQAVVAGHARVEVLRDGRSIVMSFPLR